VVVEPFGLSGLVLLTTEDRTKAEFKRRVTATGNRIAQLQCELAATKLQTVNQVLGQIGGRAPAVPQAARYLATARKSLEQAQSFVAAGDAASASQRAEAALSALRVIERAQWDAAVSTFDSPIASPAAVAFETLPIHYEWMARLGGVRPGENLLPHGDFERLDAMLQAGWQNFFPTPQGRRSADAPQVEGHADLNEAAARSGRLGLRLWAGVLQGEGPAEIESPPLWMSSAPIMAEAGAVIRIQGWVRVPRPIKGSVDGLMIVDSLGGEPLAERVRQTSGWRQFTLYRVAPESGPVRVTFVLTGLGEAWIDDVTIQPVNGVPQGPQSPSQQMAGAGR
jgi:hypothetical protein